MRLMPQAEWNRLVTTDQSGSVLKILDGTVRAINELGTRRLSMSDISEASGVSRGTLYRYFKSKNDVIAAVSEYICTSFERGVIEASEGILDPIERFRAVMRFYAYFTIERAPERMFEVEPTFHLVFLRSHNQRHKAAVRSALDPSLDYLDTLAGGGIDREMFVDILVRLQLSTLIVPATREWVELWNSTPDKIQHWLLKIARSGAVPAE
jgi:Transcriptional regulator